MEGVQNPTPGERSLAPAASRRHGSSKPSEGPRGANSFKRTFVLAPLNDPVRASFRGAPCPAFVARVDVHGGARLI